MLRTIRGRVLVATVACATVAGAGLAAFAASDGSAAPQARRAPAGAASEAAPRSSAVEAAPASPADTPAQIAQRVFGQMTVAQRVGQLFMVGVPATGATTTQLNTLRTYRIGNAMLTGRSYAGVTAVKAVTAKVRPATTQVAAPFVATDQEGGLVQVLQGTGFSAMPTALAQGRLAPATLQADARVWGGQLAAAGVNLNLAPVADVVPATNPTANQPIGRYYREYGYTPSVVSSHAVAFLQGMRQAHVQTTAKHFPGLGRATGNTDVTTGVTDPTRRGDPYLQPFQQAVTAGTPFVMVSSATYPNIDRSHPAMHSATVIGTVLRGDLRFSGVVISDDLANAKAVAALTPGARALRFFNAGGDMLLSVSTAPVAAMVQAVIAEMNRYVTFRNKVNAAVLEVLETKAATGLVH